MKFKKDFRNLERIINENEKKEISEIRQRLLIDLSEFTEWEKANLLSEIENFYSKSIQIELLERQKVNTIFELAFNDYFYRENCFLIDGNGLANITLNDRLFNDFVFGYKMLEDEYKGIAVAKNIVKVKLIEYLTSIIAEGKSRIFKHHNKEYLTFLKPWGFELFKYLDRNFEGSTFEETKYTLIYRFLIDKKISKQRRFKEFREMLDKETSISIEFVRPGKNITNTKETIYTDNEPELKRLKAEFEEINSIEFI